MDLINQMFYWMCSVSAAFIMMHTVLRFLPAGRGILRRQLPYPLFAITFMLPSWIGDENPLLVFPFFLLCFLLCYGGPWFARLSIALIFYSLLLPVNMIMDSLNWFWGRFALADLVVYGIRLAVWALVWLLARHLVPVKGSLRLPAKMWWLVGGLSLAPLFATLSFTMWNARDIDSDFYYTFVVRIAYTILPFALLSSLALLVAVMVLSRHEALEQRHQLANMREVYYEGLQREQNGVRVLRHDLCNHLSAVQGLLERGQSAEAADYLDQLTHSPALQGSKRLCENEVANAVLASKLATMERQGIRADMEVNLPRGLALSDLDLCALLGNALDNAIEALERASDKRVLLRARTDKGMFMLRTENPVERQPQQEGGRFKTTKADKEAHGFGLAGMREIAERYGGTLDARSENERFELVVCMPIA